MLVSLVLAASALGSGIEFGAPSRAGSEYYAVGFMGLMDGAHAIGHGETGWTATSDGGKSWRIVQPNHVPEGTPAPDITSAVSPGPGRLHSLGSIAPADKDKVYREVSSTDSVWVAAAATGAAGGWDFTATNKTVAFRGIPAPGISCGDSHHRFGCPFRDSGRGSVTLADGTMVMSIIVWWGGSHANPHPKLSATATSVIAFSSTDGGFEWSFAGVILDAAGAPMSEEGPNENDVVLLADGKTIMCVIRLDAGDGPLTHPYRPYVTVTSADRGATWDKMRTLPAGVGCARPRLLRADSGAIVLSGGRLNPTNRDVLLWVNYAGDGEAWEEHSITYVHNMLEKDPSLHFTTAVNDSTARETTSYTSLVKTGPQTGFLIYARHLPAQPDIGFAMPFIVPAPRPTPPGGQCAGPFTPGTRPGQDYASVKMRGTAPTARECQAMCCHDPKCATWVYVPAGLYPKRPPGTFCWLKAAPILLKGSTCDNGRPGCVSGVINRTTVA